MGALASLLRLQAPLTPLSGGFFPSCWWLFFFMPGAPRAVLQLAFPAQSLHPGHGNTGHQFAPSVAGNPAGPHRGALERGPEHPYSWSCLFYCSCLPAQSHIVAWTRRVNTMSKRNCSFMMGARLGGRWCPLVLWEETPFKMA